MSAKALTALACGALLLAACAPFDTREATSAPAPEKCEDAIAEGSGETRSQAAELAEAGTRHQFDDVRGNLLAQGLRRIRVTNAETRCRPHTLGLGLIKCTSVARLCGR